jgi:hypothetical protein
MSDFAGYVTTVIDPNKADRVVLVCDFLKKNNPEWEKNPYFPYNPLSAVGRTLDAMYVGDYIRFFCGKLRINVVNSASGKVEEYDVDRLDHELEMERLAG